MIQPNSQQQKQHFSAVTQDISKYPNNKLENNNLSDLIPSSSLNNNNDFNLPFRNDKDKFLESKLQAKTLINLSSTDGNQYNTLPQSTTAPLSIKTANKDITYSLDATGFNIRKLKTNNKDTSYDSYMNEQNPIQSDSKQQKTELSNSSNSNYNPNISLLSKTKNNQQNTK
jgi:hypothetical protein